MSEIPLRVFLAATTAFAAATILSRPGKAATGASLQPADAAPPVRVSGIGGIAETEEMLDFCAERGITADVEVIPIQGINRAYECMLKGDVKYRFVIDMASLKQVAA